MVANRCVTSAVLAPTRADALAASQPAWPPPMTMTSNSACWAIMRDFYPDRLKPGSRKVYLILFHVKRRSSRVLRCFTENRPQQMNEEILLAYTEVPEDRIQDVLDIDPPQQPAQRKSGGPQFLGDEFLALRSGCN